MGKLGKRKAHQKALAQAKVGTTVGRGITEKHKQDLQDLGYTVFTFGKSGRTYVKKGNRQQISDQVLDMGTTIPNNSPDGGPDSAHESVWVEKYPWMGRETSL